MVWQCRNANGRLRQLRQLRQQPCRRIRWWCDNKRQQKMYVHAEGEKRRQTALGPGNQKPAPLVRIAGGGTVACGVQERCGRRRGAVRVVEFGCVADRAIPIYSKICVHYASRPITAHCCWLTAPVSPPAAWILRRAAMMATCMLGVAATMPPFRKGKWRPRVKSRGLPRASEMTAPDSCDREAWGGRWAH